MSQALSKGPNETSKPLPALLLSPHGWPEAVMWLRCCNRRLLPAGCGDGWHGREESAVGAEQVSTASTRLAPVHNKLLIRGETLGGEVKEQVRGLHGILIWI